MQIISKKIHIFLKNILIRSKADIPRQESRGRDKELYCSSTKAHLMHHSSSSMLHQGAPPSLHAPTSTSLQQEIIGLLLMKGTQSLCVLAGGCDGSMFDLCCAVSRNIRYSACRLVWCRSMPLVDVQNLNRNPFIAVR